MKHYYIIIISLLINFFSIGLTCSQTTRFYTAEHDLSNSLINQIYQDKLGYIWIATEYGLNKFDGNTFTNYLHNSNDKKTLKNNYVRCLAEDQEGNLWVGCIDGLMMYDRNNDSFHEIQMKKSGQIVYPHVTQIYQLKNGEIWITTTGEGIFAIKKGVFSAYSIDSLMKQIGSQFLSVIYEDSRCNVWIGTENAGVVCYSPLSNKARVFSYPEISGNNISGIIEDNQKNIFISTLNNGLNKFDYGTFRFIPIHGQDNKSQAIKCLMIGRNNRLYIGSDGHGIMEYDSFLQCIKPSSLNTIPYDTSVGKIHSILEDRDGNIWMAVFQRGLLFIPSKRNKFDVWNLIPEKNKPIISGCVMSVYRDKEQKIWAGVDNAGLFELSENGEVLRHFCGQGQDLSVPNTILCISLLSKENFSDMI